MRHLNDGGATNVDVQTDWPKRMPGRVLVTGANGHLANTLVRNLLDHGYTVRGTVRDLSDPARTAHLHAHAKALGCPERLDLVEADVLDADPWPALLEGMDGLFHTATVFSLSGDAETILSTANLGTEHLMRGAAVAGVPRIVYTSSTAAVGSTPKGRTKTEEDWQPEEGTPYTVAKTQGEQRLWRLVEELNLDVRVINPSAILGGGFVRPTPSIDYFPDLLGGAWPIAPPIPMAFVHVEDVAEAPLLRTRRGLRPLPARAPQWPHHGGPGPDGTPVASDVGGPEACLAAHADACSRACGLAWRPARP